MYFARLKRRIESYRRRQTDCMPRFDQSFSGICEQNLQDTLQLKQRFLDTKSKTRSQGGPKTKHQDKKGQQQLLAQSTAIQSQNQQEGAPPPVNTASSSSIQSSVHVVSI